MTIRSEAGDVKEDFTVLKDNKDVRHGEYQMIFNSKIITAGHYENGARSGKWIYNDYNGIINFDGYFKNDSKDSIWTYYIGDTLQARMFYSHGVLDSSLSYYSNGNVLFEQRLDENGTGETIHYSPKGAIITHFPKVNKELDGVVTVGHENGEIYRKVEFQSGKPYNLVLTQNQVGNRVYGGSLKNGTGTYMDYATVEDNDSVLIPSMVASYRDGNLNGPYIEYPINGLIGQKGNYLNGYRTGEWVSFTLETVIKTIDYDVQDSISGAVMDKSLSPYGYTFESMPYFPGGEEAMMPFLAKNISYPHAEADKNIQGMVRITFFIDEEGNIHVPDELNHPERALDQEGMRVVASMPRWNPGFQNGLPVSVEYSIPLRFSLRGNR